MKKLMTVMASAATALFALGAANGQEVVTEPLNATSFEALNLNARLNTLADDTGNTEGTTKYWYMASTDEDNGTLVTNEVAGAGVSRPDYFDGDDNEKALALDTSSPLFRHMGTSDGTIPAAGEAIGDGIYLDTLVKFTAADDVFGDDALAAGDKIAISYVEQSDEVENPITNFVIRAGKKVGEDIQQVNYIAAVPAGFDKDAWHRLTVRAIADVGDGQVGFIVYLDGDMEKLLAYDVSVDAGFTSVSGTYADKYYNSTIHAIYPSAVAALATGGSTITAASFSGTGAIDDVVFTTVKPSFIIESPKVTFTWDEDVTALTIGTKTLSEDEVAAGEIIVDLVGATISVTATVDSSAGKVARYTTTGDGAWDSTNGQFTGLVAGDTCNIAAIVPAFEVGGVPFTAEELTDVITAATAGTQASPVTVKLVADCEQALTFTAGYVILDLAGCDVQGDPLADDFSIGNVGANLTIINTGTEASVKTAMTGAVFTQSGFTTITAGTYDGSVATVADYDETGTLVKTDYMTITGGKFVDTVYDPLDPEAPFYLAPYVAPNAGGYSRVNNTDYVQVGGDTPQPETYDVTYTKPDHATVVTDPAAITGLEVGDSVEFTVTPDTDYTYTGVTIGEDWELEQDGTITMTYTVVAGENAVTIPDPVEIVSPEVFDITWSGAANATVVTDPAELEDLEVNSTVTFTATPDTGYTYEGVALGGWVRNSETGAISYTLTVTREEEVVIPDAVSSDEKTYPSYIGTDTEKKEKYDAWAKANNISDTDFPDADGTNKDAYLLNCAPDKVEAETAAFKFTSISYDADKEAWVTETTTKNTSGNEYNGTVTVKQYSDVGCTTESDKGTFFKATLD